MAQITLNSSGVASNGTLALQSNGTTTAVTIDASQNVGIGIATPAKRLSVVNATDATTVGTNSVMTVQAGSSINSVAEIGFSYGSWGGTNPIASLGYQITSNAGVGSGALTFSTRSVTTDTAPSERMRIDSSGNVGIGLIPTGDTLLEIYGANSATTYKNVNTGTGSSDGFYVGMAKSSGTDGYVYNRESANVIFGTANAERMRIDSSGNLLVGTTSGTGSRMDVEAADEVVSFNRSAATDGVVQRWRKAGSTVGYVSTNTYSLPSDERVKTNIVNIGYGLDFVNSLRPVQYNTIFQDPENETKKNFGLIAQEVEQALANIGKSVDDVTFLEKFVPENDAESRYGLGYQNLVPVLIKAIQEQQAIIQTLTDRITALEQA